MSKWPDLNILFLFSKDEVVESVAPEATNDGYAFQVGENQSTFNF